ncbi:dethiobiotin synthase [Sulfurimonas sp. MAG313]|nr:dethiobiotin synthase [Sulfurimonas sp. MAG313]MDF1879954.1 dethiobiotin synthase [Sulfurimonas sp. MAG313]
MSKRIFITATNTDVGKTYATLKLLKELSSQGLKVGVFKPIETGVQTHPLDGTKLFDLALSLNPKLKSLNINDIVPYQFELPAAPIVAKGDTNIDVNYLIEKLEKIEALCDVVLIEGAGGLMVPVQDDLFMVDFITYFKATTLLISPSKLGSINDTLLSKHLLDTRKISFTWAINIHQDKDSFHEVTAPYYKNNFLSLQDDIKAIKNELMASFK